MLSVIYGLKVSSLTHDTYPPRTVFSDASRSHHGYSLKIFTNFKESTSSAVFSVNDVGVLSYYH